MPPKRVSGEKNAPPTMVRAVTFAVSHVADGGSWGDFMKTLHALWRDGTAAANNAIRYYAMTDDPLEAKTPKLYAYPHLAKAFPSIGTGTLASIGQNTLQHYKRHRQKFWRGDCALPLYRYPFPYPIRAQDWATVLIDGQRPGFCISTGQKAGEGIRRWRIALQGGPGFHRQLGRFRQILAGEAKPCEAALYRQRSGGTHRNGVSEKTSGGASRVHYRVMLKLVARFPRSAPIEGTQSLILRTDPAALWVAEHSGRMITPWVLNGDEAKRWLSNIRTAHLDHAAKRQRMSEDMKLERRTHVGKRQQMLCKLEQMCNKHHRRLRTFVQQCAAGIINYCIRQKIVCLIYDDTDHGWMPSFPWYALRVELRNRCEDAGIEAGGTLSLAETECEEDCHESVLST